MKRKLALMLAVAMTLSLLPMNLFAASDNRLTSYPTTTGNKTVFVERGVLNASNGTRYVAGNGQDYTDTFLEIDGNDDIEQIVDAPFFEIEMKGEIPALSTFQISLENARWFFRGPSGLTGKWKDNGRVTGSALRRSGIAANDRTSPVEGYRALGSGTNQFGLNRTYRYMVSGTAPLATNDSDTTAQSLVFLENNGVYVRYRTTADAVAAATNGDTLAQIRSTTYVRRAAILYILTVSGGDDKVATVEFPTAVTYGSTPDAMVGVANKFWIPLISRTINDDDVKVIVSDTGNSGITAGTFVYSASAATNTRTYVDDPKTARDEFPINLLVIKELKIASMETGSVEISAPSGFYFAASSFNSMQVVAENFGYGTSAVLINCASDASKGYTYSNRTGSPQVPGGMGTHADIHFKLLSNGEIDYSVIVVDFKDLSEYKSTRLPGTIYLKSAENSSSQKIFKLIAEDNVKDGDVMLKIKNVGGKEVVTDESFKAGTRKDWTIDFQTIGTIPTLVNGRYEQEDSKDADDEKHLAAKVKFYENTVNAWWAGRYTDFVLPEGVKIRKVEITKAKEVAQKSDLEAGNPDYDGYYMNTGKKYGYVTINDNKFTINNVQVNSDKKAELEFKLWLSIESGWEGDITLAATGSGVPDDIDPIVIAKAINPVELVTTVTDVLIGYQYFPVADIEMIETESGMLEKGKKVYLSVTDRINMDMYFTPGFKAEVTEGNIKIKNVDIGTSQKISISSSRVSGADLGSGTIVFDVDAASGSASTIKFSNMQLKIDRTVPETQVPYAVYAWGPNIAPNCDIFDYTGYMDKAYLDNDLHTSLGISAPYIRVVSASPEKSNILSSVVKVTIDSNTAYVNGEQVAIDPAAYIDGGRTMIPLRALSTLLGVREEQIIWSDSARTVTINMPSRVVQFTIGSNVMLVNGAGIEIDVPAIIKGGRTFIPFRALGEGLSVKVTWDEPTRTATYNEE